MSAHPHAAFIAEALQDTSREIEGKKKDGIDCWQPFSIQCVAGCNENYEFRFKPTKPVVVSTLSKEDFIKIYESVANQALRSQDIHMVINYAEAIANAACAEERKRICSLPSVTSLTKDDLMVEYIGGFNGVANAAIAQFLKDILEGKI